MRRISSLVALIGGSLSASMEMMVYDLDRDMQQIFATSRVIEDVKDRAEKKQVKDNFPAQRIKLRNFLNRPRLVLRHIS